jgi:hypothetical protein
MTDGVSLIPTAQAMAKDLQEACMRRGLAIVEDNLRRNDLTADEEEQLFVEAGIAAGVAAALQELVERGMLPSA